MSGPVPVSFSEIEAWSRVTGIEIPGYEAVQLRQLSRDYCNQHHASKNPSEPQPIMPGEDATPKQVVREQVARGLADLVAQHKQKAKL